MAKRSKWIQVALGLGAAGILFFGLLLLGACGKTKNSSPLPSLTRFADPAWIERIDLDYFHLQGQQVVSENETPLVRLDRQTLWHPFFWPHELQGKALAKGRDKPTFGYFSKTRDRLLIRPRMGIARVVPVEPLKEIYLECHGDFSPEEGISVAVTQLGEAQTLPSEAQPGLINKLVRESVMGTTYLNRSEDGKSASVFLPLHQTTQALLILVVCEGKSASEFEYARMVYPSERHRWLRARMSDTDFHPAFMSDAFIEHTLRPSLILTPGTVVRLKPFIVPENAVFRCSLGVEGGLTYPMRFVLEAVGDEEKRIINERLQPGPETWLDLEEDLEDFNGREVNLRMTCEWIEPERVPEDKYPLVYCGSPVLYAEKTEPKPDPGLNLVFISIDTLRRDRLGCYGYHRPTSPTIDQYASEQILFEQAYSHAAYTLPSHASMFTSLYPSTHGANCDIDQIPTSIDTLAETLARKGWATAGYNNAGYVSHEFGFHRGFDIYCEVDPLGDRYLNGASLNGRRFADGATGSLDRAMDWMSEQEEQPFFLFLHTFLVHEYMPPKDRAEEFNRGCASKLEPGHESIIMLNHKKVAENPLSSEDLEFFQNMYDATVREVDEMVEKVLDQIRGQGLEDRTVVVITSDHGEEFWEHEGIRHTLTLYEEMIQVPLIIAVPGRPGGLRIPNKVSQVDLLPTLLELMGIEPVAQAQGRSLVPLLEGGDRKDRLIFAEANLLRQVTRSCLIWDDWKIHWGDTDPDLIFPAKKDRELYNLQTDIEERNDLYGDPASPTRDLDRMLKRLKTDLNLQKEKFSGGEEKKKGGISKELKEMLQQQGYL